MNAEERQAAHRKPPDIGQWLQAAQGALLLALLTVPLFVREIAKWPWHLLVPLGVYAFVVCLVGPLRRSVTWVRFGRLRGRVLVATSGVIAITTSALVLFDALSHPDVTLLLSQLPLRLPIPLVVVGALFAIVNALMEEAIFRGILFDSFVAQVGMLWAIVVQGVLFGTCHFNGYPPGIIGLGLAAVYGLMLGLLRHWSGGILAPWVAHVFADATIFWIVVAAVE